MTTICLCSYKAPERLEKTLKAIDAVRKYDDVVYLNYAGDIESADKVRESKGVQFCLAESKMVGFSKSYNALLVNAMLTQENILLMSDDAEPIGTDWLRDLELYLKSDPKIGGITPFELFRGQFCDLAWSPVTGQQITEREIIELHRFYDMPYCNCSIALFNWEALVRVGLFDENYSPAYYDDNDLGMRMWLAGYRCVCYTGAKFYHLRGQTIPTFYPSRQAQYHRMKWDWLIDNLKYEDLMSKLRKVASEGLPAILGECDVERSKA